jgi:hypothetical protein
MMLDWQDVAFGVFFFVVVLRIVVSRFLANELRRYAPTTWELLGKPILHGESSNRNLPGFDWNIWARTSEVRRIRALIYLKLACSAAAWMIALAIITFSDLNRYAHFSRFAPKGIDVWNDILRLLAGCLSIVSFYICFETIRMLPSAEEGSGNIGRGLIALIIGFSCLALAIKL